MFNALLSPAGDDLKSTSARMTYGDYSGASSASMAHVAAAIRILHRLKDLALPDLLFAE
jgi:hypothetical protein